MDSQWSPHWGLPASCRLPCQKLAPWNSTLPDPVRLALSDRAHQTETRCIYSNNVTTIFRLAQNLVLPQGPPPGVLTSRFYGNGEQHSSGCCHSNLCINEDPGMRADPRVALVMNTLPSLPQPRFTQYPQEVSTHILRNDSLCF